MHGIEKEMGRPVYGLADDLFKGLPVVGTMWSRVGGVAAHPENAYRLLREQEQLALVFPEGTKGTGKLYGERYQLRRFGRGGFVEIAMRAGVPIVPIAVVGSEEAMPIVARSPGSPALLGVPYVPVTANMLAVRPARARGAAPGQVQGAGPRPVTFDVPARSGALLQEQGDGRSRGHPRAHPGRSLRHAASPPQRVDRLGHSWVGGS